MFKLAIIVMRTILCTLIVLAALSPLASADVRVLDQNGLIRAIKVTDQAVQVRLVLTNQTTDTSQVVLSHIDGVARDVKPHLTTQESLVFSLAQGGSWQIKNLAQDKIKEVKIE